MNTLTAIARLALAGAVLAAVAGPALAQDAAKGQPATAPARAPRPAGRWNLTVEVVTPEGNRYTHPGWLGITRKGGKYLGRYLGGAGKYRADCEEIPNSAKIGSSVSFLG